MDEQDRKRIRDFVEGMGEFEDLGLDWLVDNLSVEELIRASRTQQWAWEALRARIQLYRDKEQEFPPELALCTCAMALGELQPPPLKPGPKPDVDHHIRVEAAVDSLTRTKGISVEEARAEVADALCQSDNTIKTARKKGQRVWKTIKDEI